MFKNSKKNQVRHPANGITDYCMIWMPESGRYEIQSTGPASQLRPPTEEQ
jgi:hypothetical protein